MHHSRLVGFVIDCQGGDLEQATHFWARALGKEVKTPEPESPTYRELKTAPDEPVLLLQQVDHPSRVHLDIETDDVEAEATRLEGLGAKRIAKVQTWWVMEAPTGHRFCVVRPQRPETLASRGNVW